MSSGQGGAKEVTNQTTTTAPDQATMNYLNQFIRPIAAQGANTALTGPSWAPNVTPEFQAGLDRLGVNADFGGGYTPQMMDAFTQFQAAQAGGAGGGGGLGFSPSQVDTSRIQAFMDPYEGAVVSGAQSDFDRQRQLAMQSAQQQATQAGAFGGSRGEVLQAQAFGDISQQEIARLAQIRSQGFSQALGATMDEWGIMQQLGMQGAIAGMQNEQFNAGEQNKMALGFADLDYRRQASNQDAGIRAADLNQRGRIAAADQNFRNAVAQIEAAEKQRQVMQQQAMEPILRQQMAMEFRQAGMGPGGTTSNMNQTARAGGTNAFGTALGGATLGAQWGPWGALIGGGAGLLGGLLGGRA